MPVELRRGSLHLTGSSLAFDSRRKSELSFVSHAHTDHIARHERVIATRQTLRFMEHRLGPIQSALSVPYNRPFELGRLNVELVPAGHVLGSAQIRVTRDDGHRVVYTGDISLESSMTAEPAQILECDTLVLESTFGQPRFKFPKRDDVFTEVADWAKRHLSRGVRPILYAYSLGKGQETIKQLTSRGLKLCAHGSLFEIATLYTELGMPIEVRKFDGTFEPDEVGIFPPFGRSAALKKIMPRATAVLTGWAIDSWAARRYNADVAFPVSDHADFASLVKIAKGSRAREVICHHGFAKEFAAELRKIGVFARAITQAVQMELTLSAPPPVQAALIL